jgi:hypothetical protein
LNILENESLGISQTLGLVPKSLYEARYPNVPLESVENGSVKVPNYIEVVKNG